MTNCSSPGGAAQPCVRPREPDSATRARRPSSPRETTPKVADYSIRKTYGHLLDMVEEAFAKDKPLFALPIYYPLAYYIGDDKSIDPLLENRQQQVVSLIRTNFLKRFESSVVAFERSCESAAARSCSPSWRFTANRPVSASASSAGRARTQHSRATSARAARPLGRGDGR